MRELKFRAWSATTKKMLDRVLAGPGDPCSIVWSEDREEWLNFDSACGEIMQYTGLNDKNDREIYEGDILLIGGSEETRFYPNVDVRWYFNRWVFFGRNDIHWDFHEIYFEQGEVEVIGNIYETPDLVKEGHPNG